GPDDADFGTLLISEFLAAALFKGCDRVLTLLDHLLQYADNVGIGQPRLLCHLRLNVGVLDGRIDEPQRREFWLLLRLHGALHCLVDLIAQSHRLILASSKVTHGSS